MKKILVLLLVTGILGVAAVGALLVMQPEETDPEPGPIVSAPLGPIEEEEDPQLTAREKQEKELSTVDTSEYKFAAIAGDDTVRLYNLQGEEVIINLDHKYWKDLQWSKEGTFVSVLGSVSGEVFDLYIYDFYKEEWVSATSYETVGAGVRSYVWADDMNIIYTQGGNDQIWLHTFDYLSFPELLKVQTVPFDVESITRNGELLIGKTGQAGKTAIYSKEGDLLWDLSGMTSETGIAVKPEVFVLDTDGERVVLSSPVNAYVKTMYKTLVGSNLALDMFIENGVIPFCAVEEGLFIGYTTDGENISKLLRFTIQGTVEEEVQIAEGIIPTSGLQNAACIKKDLLFYSALINEQVDWYFITFDGEPELVDFISNATEVVLNPHYFL